ncbi:peptidyl-prolyl cis-trans isomerase [Methylosinus sp. KRF6]|uniref:peptidyl-prolyl cis-trans isomerase n=1 Tax=Methylosinus sp. KRF6 TaxID=2846853 RepID=UPI001C0AED9C|nr:peptidyl-prolyl cis-trans isomerase [Methylosinus sp. KRF6]MBU3887042.1 peptidyl-prolyl cis-trans isomerase [Methylosinus sp. KRF6]
MNNVSSRVATLYGAVRALAIGATMSAAMSMPSEALAQSLFDGFAAPKPKPRPAQQAPSASKPKPPAESAGVNGKTSEEVVAHVGGSEITASQLRAYFAALGAREQAAIVKEPALLSQAVRALLNERIVLQEAIAEKWDQQPHIAAQLEQVRERAIVELFLQSVSNPPANFPSEDELQKAYDANRSAFVVPRQFQLGHIFVSAPKDADRATEEKAKKSLDEIERKLKAAGADFMAVARAGNEAADGGEPGWVAEGQIRPEIRTRVMGLAKGAVSESIHLDDGWHIVKLIDTKASYTRPLAEARDQLAQQMRAERASALRRAYVNELLKRHPAAVNEIALSNLLASVPK